MHGNDFHQLAPHRVEENLSDEAVPFAGREIASPPSAVRNDSKKS